MRRVFPNVSFSAGKPFPARRRGMKVEMARVLFAANTPYQLIVAVQLAVTEFQNDVADVLVTDHIAQYLAVAQGAAQSGVFHRVYTMKARDGKWNSWKYTALGFLYNETIYRRFPEIRENRYDVYFFANHGGVSECLATFLRKKQGTALYMYEDGFSSYSDACRRELEKTFRPAGLKAKLLYARTKRAPNYIQRYYVFYPELIREWNFPFEIRGIEKIGEKTVGPLNAVFQYDASRENYDFDYIFFEESYFADGYDVGDVKLVETIAELVGRERMKIKIHPRNPENRFAKLGFATNQDTGTPWEIVALNVPLQGKKLIALSSGSSVTSRFLSGKRADRSIFLYHMEGVDKSRLTPAVKTFDLLCGKDPYFAFPRTAEELKNVLLEKREQV